jgi:subtilisin-like proprotein convertase family protein
MKIFTIISALAISSGLVLGQTNMVSTNYTFNISQVIPDGSQIGLVSATNLTGIDLDAVSSITVNLDISGGYNGDLYAYLVGPGGTFDLLLNRTGTGGGDDFGYGDAGFNITFDDSSPNNIQNYQTVDNPGGGQLTGTWQSAGDSLGSFAGINPNGTWTLFVADLSSGGGQSVLQSWGLTITSAVPEPQAWAMCATGAVLLLAGFKWRRKVN